MIHIRLEDIHLALDLSWKRQRVVERNFRECWVQCKARYKVSDMMQVDIQMYISKEDMCDIRCDDKCLSCAN